MVSAADDDRYVAFFQNGQQAYACEMEPVSTSRCGKID